MNEGYTKYMKKVHNGSIWRKPQEIDQDFWDTLGPLERKELIELVNYRVMNDKWFRALVWTILGLAIGCIWAAGYIGYLLYTDQI
jgi:hypothetical protein